MIAHSLYNFFKTIDLFLTVLYHEWLLSGVTDPALQEFQFKKYSAAFDQYSVFLVNAEPKLLFFTDLYYAGVENLIVLIVVVTLVVKQLRKKKK